MSQRLLCQDIAINTDSVVENAENFDLILAQSSSDAAVSIPPGSASAATVIIVDNTSE